MLLVTDKHCQAVRLRRGGEEEASCLDSLACCRAGGGEWCRVKYQEAFSATAESGCPAASQRETCQELFVKAKRWNVLAEAREAARPSLYIQTRRSP